VEGGGGKKTPPEELLLLVCLGKIAQGVLFKKTFRQATKKMQEGRQRRKIRGEEKIHTSQLSQVKRARPNNSFTSARRHRLGLMSEKGGKKGGLKKGKMNCWKGGGRGLHQEKSNIS